jgi:hypothetical protein
MPSGWKLGRDYHHVRIRGNGVLGSRTVVEIDGEIDRSITQLTMVWRPDHLVEVSITFLAEMDVDQDAVEGVASLRQPSVVDRGPRNSQLGVVAPVVHRQGESGRISGSSS